MRDALPADGRMRYSNFGKGVVFWETHAEAACYVNAVDCRRMTCTGSPTRTCAASARAARCSPAGRGAHGDRVSAGVELRRTSSDRVRALVSPARSRPIWNFIEVGHPFTENDAPTINGPQIRAAVWHSIIAGARGILYFNHNFGGAAPVAACAA